MTHRWFDYLVRVQPHHTDYGGVVWHGTYVQWLEAARVECLRELGVAFEDLVNLGYDLPVIDLSVRYHQPLTLGMAAVVKARLAPVRGVRLSWHYQIESLQHQRCASAEVTLVPIDMTRRRIVRRMPDDLRQVIQKIEAYFAPTEAPLQ
ncbi:MAG: acyl-CoA thioesterase [Leptolyngbya sp. SIO4C1]|nr:acyl-CoA thioesterase [Leptolyngbya sp. SIO4C1]